MLSPQFSVTHLALEPLRMAAAEFDVFLSHAWADGERPQQLANALTQAGLRVWFDAAEINDFASITRAVTEGMAKSKALVVYYSKTYPLRRACQWELTAAFLAAQAEGDPRHRVLVINSEEKADHIHPVELRDAKFRNAPKSDGEMQQLVQAIVKQVGELSGPLADIHPLTAPNWYGMTPVGSTRFVGRLKEMWEVHSLLHAGDVAQITGAAAATGGIGRISGLGGVGKSLLAEEYALHFGAAYPGGVFWVRAYGNDDAKPGLGATEREALRADQVRQVAERLGISAQGLTAEQVEGELARKIAGEGKDCLWVVDDVPNGLDGEALRRWFAPHPLARTLITTRSGEYGSLANGIDLSVLTPDEAGQLLTSRREPLNDAEKEQARELAKDLGYHALALDVSASALKSFSGDEPYRQFREELADQDDDALEMAKDWGQDLLPNGHEKSIAQTMLRSIRGLGVEGLDFLRLASVLAVAPIPGSLVTAVFETADGLDRGKPEQRQRQAFTEVDRASLAEIAGENQEARSVHTLVSRVVRFDEKATPERTQALRNVAVVALGMEIANAAKDPRLHKQIEFHMVHARQVVTMPKNVPEASLVSWVARYDFERGAYASARTLCERELEFNRRVLGPEHPDTLASMHNLASTLYGQGDLAGARKLQEEELVICRRVVGPEHPYTLNSMSNLANTLGAQGNLAEARKLKEETLAIQRRVLDLEHPDTLNSMHNLAMTLRAQGELAAARELQDDVLHVQRRVLGPDHPRTLLSMNQLAETKRMQGHLSAARRLQEETLAINRRVLGPEHPYTLNSMSNLALTLHEQGHFAGARKLNEEALAIKRRVLGSEHPDTLTSVSNLALMLQAQGDLAGARKLGEEVLGVDRHVLGPEHTQTLTSMSNLASTMYAQGDLQGSFKLFEEEIYIRRRVLGCEHPDTSLSAWNLFSTLRDLGKRAAARALLERDLLWLLDRDPDSLGAQQRQIREQVAQVVGKSG
jgi:tetratricopeptide (TPR) repeat protein